MALPTRSEWSQAAVLVTEDPGVTWTSKDTCMMEGTEAKDLERLTLMYPVMDNEVFRPIPYLDSLSSALSKVVIPGKFLKVPNQTERVPSSPALLLLNP
ncbi:hypothetical protein CB1_064113027 [Camelus ferus]|nr:hypothetical protein CB1_064113027 [Camelus ferus]